MDYYAGIDVPLELSSVCVVDASGKIVRESKVESKPDAQQQHFADLGYRSAESALRRGHCRSGCTKRWFAPAMT